MAFGREKRQEVQAAAPQPVKVPESAPQPVQAPEEKQGGSASFLTSRKKSLPTSQSGRSFESLGPGLF